MKKFLLPLFMLPLSCAQDVAACTQVTHDEVEYCVHEGPITETGYECPPEQPNMFRDEDLGLVVCSGEAERPPFEEVHDAYNHDNRPTERVVNTTGGDDCEDEDGDGFGAGSEQSRATCPACADRGQCAVDCVEGDASINPEALEVCDGVDNDCDGEVDEQVLCETAEDCPSESPFIYRCNEGLCEYGTPLQNGEGCRASILCVDGARTAPAQCF